MLLIKNQGRRLFEAKLLLKQKINRINSSPLPNLSLALHRKSATTEPGNVDLPDEGCIAALPLT
jgi:hypothetical protein